MTKLEKFYNDYRLFTSNKSVNELRLICREYYAKRNLLNGKSILPISTVPFGQYKFYYDAVYSVKYKTPIIKFKEGFYPKSRYARKRISSSDEIYSGLFIDSNRDLYFECIFVKFERYRSRDEKENVRGTLQSVGVQLCRITDMSIAHKKFFYRGECLNIMNIPDDGSNIYRTNMDDFSYKLVEFCSQCKVSNYTGFSLPDMLEVDNNCFYRLF